MQYVEGLAWKAIEALWKLGVEGPGFGRSITESNSQEDAAADSIGVLDAPCCLSQCCVEVMLDWMLGASGLLRLPRERAQRHNGPELDPGAVARHPNNASGPLHVHMSSCFLHSTTNHCAVLYQHTATATTLDKSTRRAI